MIRFKCQIVVNSKVVETHNSYAATLTQAAWSAAKAQGYEPNKWDFIEGVFDPDNITDREQELLDRGIPMLYLSQQEGL